MKILRSKFSIPKPAPYIIFRHRLIDKILSSDATLILLVAPAGYGKTITAQQVYSKLAKVHKGWYHLDARDADPRRFLSYLLEIFSELVPSFTKSGLGRKLEDNDYGVNDLTQDLCFLFNEFEGQPVWLVLDNWELVNDHKDIQAILNTLIDNTDNKLKLIINSRLRPSIKTQKMRETGRAVVINEKELAFSFPEFIEVVGKRVKAPVNELEMEKIWRVTSGWCINLGLILELLHRRGAKYSSDILQAIVRSKSLSEYLREELLADLPEEFLEFLCRSSIIDIISPERCNAIFNDEEFVLRNIRILSNSGIPHFALMEQDNYRLHPLVRQETLALLRTKLSADELMGLYLSAANYFLHNGSVMTAIETLIDGGNHGDALEIIDKHWYTITDLDGLPQLERWLQDFPESTHKHPLYIKIKSNLLSIFGYNQQLIEYLPDKINPDNFQKGDNTLCVLWVRYNWARLHTVDEPQYEAINNSWEILNLRNGPFGAAQRAGVELTLSCGAYMELKVELALAHVENCLSLIDVNSHAYRLDVSDNKALFLHMMGKSQEALGLLEEGVARANDLKIFSRLAHRIVTIGWIYCSMGEYRKALEKIGVAIEMMDRHTGSKVGTLMYADRYAGLSLWYLGYKDEGIKRLEKSYDCALEYNPKEAILTGLYIEYFKYLDGNFRAAKTLPIDTKDQHVGSTKLVFMAICAFQQLQSGDIKRSSVLIDEISGFARDQKLLPWEITADFLYAYSTAESGPTDKSLNYLEKGLAGLKQLGWIAYPMCNDILTSFVIAKSLRYNIDPETARQLIPGISTAPLKRALESEIMDTGCTAEELRRLIGAAASFNIRGLHSIISSLRPEMQAALAGSESGYIAMLEAELLPPLEIKMFGEFSVLTQANVVRFSRKKSKSLLQILLIEYPQAVHEEVIIESLWPESDPDKGRTNLRTTVKDLRRALDPFYEPRGKSYIKYADEHYSLELPEGSSVDYLQFTGLLKSSLPILKAGMQPGSEQLNDIGKALKLFDGEFLAKERFESYTLETRETLQKMYHDAALAYSSELINRNELQEALLALEKGLRLDPLWSEGVYQLMIALEKSGELFKALRNYREYEKKLFTELGLPPDNELKRYFESLAQN